MTKGKLEAQSYEEMTDAMEDSKAKGLATHHGNSIYKEKSGEYQEDKLKALVAAKTEELADVATKEKVSLENVSDVQKRTIVYLRACEETGTFPSMLGLARALGYSRRSLSLWIQKKGNTPTGQWLEMFSDTCADVLTQSALKNNANSIVSIFLSKSMYGLRETDELIITPNKADIENEDSYDTAAIKSRYLPNYGKENET